MPFDSVMHVRTDLQQYDPASSQVVAHVTPQIECLSSDEHSSFEQRHSVTKLKYGSSTVQSAVVMPHASIYGSCHHHARSPKAPLPPSCTFSKALQPAEKRVPVQQQPADLLLPMQAFCKSSCRVNITGIADNGHL